MREKIHSGSHLLLDQFEAEQPIRGLYCTTVFQTFAGNLVHVGVSPISWSHRAGTPDLSPIIVGVPWSKAYFPMYTRTEHTYS